MRLQPILAVGLSALTAFASATGATAGSVNPVDAEKRGLGNEIFYHARDAVVGAIHEIEARVPHGHHDPHGSPHKKTHPATKKTTAKHSTKATHPKTTSKEHHTTTKEHHTTKTSEKHHTKTSDKHHTTTSDKHHTTTKTSTSASPTSTIKPRVRCGQKGNTCSSDSCDVARSIDLRQAVNRRAYGAPTGNIRNLINRKGNVKLSDQSRRDAWIDFGTDAASVTIGGLTGCTAVIAISEKGMYAFHIWEAGDGDTLDPSKYHTTLANIQSKLASKRTELAGGKLYIYIPTNPDQKGELLYDSTHWNEALTEDVSEPVKPDDKEWPKQVKRVDAIKDAVTAGSGLSITKMETYEAPPKGVRTSDWMTAQFDPAESETTKQFGVWTSKQDQIAQVSW